jgi:Icc protein
MTDTILQFVQISDTHISADREYGKQHSLYSTCESAEMLVRQISSLPFKPDFVLHTGDVAYDPDPTAYEMARSILGQIPYPIYYVAGNHDYPGELQRVMAGREEILLSFYYSFEVKGVQIVVLDSNGPAEPPRGFVNQEQLDWLDEICSSVDDRPMVVAIHHNILPVGVPWLDDYMRTMNGEDVHRSLLKAHNRLRGVFFGHVHQNINMYSDGILYTSGLSSWNQFHAWPGQAATIPHVDSNPGFNIVTLTHNGTYIRHCQYRQSSIPK